MMKVTARDVKVALAACGVDVEKTFTGYAWNDKRKNGRRLKFVYSGGNRVDGGYVIAVNNLLNMMFPNQHIVVRDHYTQISGRCRYNSFVIHATNK